MGHVFSFNLIICMVDYNHQILHSITYNKAKSFYN